MELQRSNQARQRSLYLEDFAGVAKSHESMNFYEVQDPRWIIILEKEMSSIDKKTIGHW
jgi:hypothetical protein